MGANTRSKFFAEKAAELGMLTPNQYKDLKGITYNTLNYALLSNRLVRPDGSPGWMRIGKGTNAIVRLIYPDAKILPPKQVQIGNNRKQISKGQEK